MALEILADFFSWIFYQAQLAGWQLLPIVLTAIFLLLLIVRKSSNKKSRRKSPKYLPPVQQLDSSTEHRQKAWQRIELLLQEIAASAQADKTPKGLIDKSSVCSKPLRHKVSKKQKPNRMQNGNTRQKEHPEGLNNPLDLRELQIVSLMAKQLRSRSRHRLHR